MKPGTHCRSHPVHPWIWFSMRQRVFLRCIVLHGLQGLSKGACCCRNHPTHFWNQYCVLQRRALQAYTRNPLNVAGRTMMAIFIGILGGLVFMKDVHGELGGTSRPLPAFFPHRMPWSLSGQMTCSKMSLAEQNWQMALLLQGGDLQVSKDSQMAGCGFACRGGGYPPGLQRHLLHHPRPSSGPLHIHVRPSPHSEITSVLR